MDIRTALQRSGAFKVRDNNKVSPSFPLNGGLNLADSPMDIPPGNLIGCSNFEPNIRVGYRRVDGYERFDGHPSPSDSNFYAIEFTSSGGFTPAAGATVTESGSGATGAVAYLDSANGYVIVVNVTGTFVGAGSTLTSGAQTATTIGSPIINGGPTNALANTYYYQKWLYLQPSIGTVGGAACSGPVLGVVPYLGAVYAFRNNSAGTAALMFQSTSTGWQQVALGTKVRFNQGIYSASMTPIPEGTVLKGATSGATFTVRRVGTLTGTWGTDAAGYIITDAITGTPVANEALQVGATTYCTYLSSAAQTIAAGGSYHFRTHNFTATQNPATGFRLYGVNGVSNGFEFDSQSSPAVFVNIETGMSADTPSHLEIHSQCLFYAFPAGSLQNSGAQKPLSWTIVTGADERSVGEPITMLREDVSQTLFIGTRRNVWQLSGLQPEQFQMTIYAPTTGVIAMSDETPGKTIFAEDRGITTLSAAAQYGNFEAGSLSDLILVEITTLIKSDTVVAAIITRKKNLYRLIFASGTVLNLAINAQGKFTGWTPSNWAHNPSCASSGFTQTSGVQIERMFFGGNNGYVYEIDKGRSFDGQNIQAFFKTAYWHVKSPMYFKKFTGYQIDMKPEGSATINVACDCDYGARSPMLFQGLALAGGGALWDVGIWNQFTWDSPIYQPQWARLEIEGYNISLTVSGNANNDVPYTVSSVLYQSRPHMINRNSQEA